VAYLVEAGAAHLPKTRDQVLAAQAGQGHSASVVTVEA